MSTRQKFLHVYSPEVSTCLLTRSFYMSTRQKFLHVYSPEVSTCLLARSFYMSTHQKFLPEVCTYKYISIHVYPPEVSTRSFYQKSVPTSIYLYMSPTRSFCMKSVPTSIYLYMSTHQKFLHEVCTYKYISIHVSPPEAYTCLPTRSFYQ
jgi:hypothetical protein